MTNRRKSPSCRNKPPSLPITNTRRNMDLLWLPDVKYSLFQQLKKSLPIKL